MLAHSLQRHRGAFAQPKAELLYISHQRRVNWQTRPFSLFINFTSAHREHSSPSLRMKHMQHTPESGQSVHKLETLPAS